MIAPCPKHCWQDQIRVSPLSPFTLLMPTWYALGAFSVVIFTSFLSILLVAIFFASLKPFTKTSFIP